MTDNGFLTNEFWSARTSVFLQFIVREMKMQHLQSYQWYHVMPLQSQLLVHNHRRTETRAAINVVIHLDCDRRRARLKSDPFERKRIDTPEGESEKACMNIAAANMAKCVGARMHPCLTDTIIVRELTGELIVYQNSHCHVSVQALQDSDTFGGTSHFVHDDPQSIAVHGVKRFGEINKGYVRRCYGVVLWPFT